MQIRSLVFQIPYLITNNFNNYLWVFYMKKINLIIAFGLLFSTVVFSQNMNGKITLGGKISIENKSDDYKNNFSSYIKKETQNSLIIGPSIGYFISDHLQFGLGLFLQNNGYDFEGTEQYYSSKRSISMISFSPSLRYYGEVFPSFGFWGDLSFNFGFGSRKDTDWEYNGTSNPPKIETEYDLTNFAFSLRPGVYYFLNDHFELNLSFGGLYYASISTTVTKPKLPDEPKNIQSQFGFDFSLYGMTLGLNYIF